jgi:hypothetical protein
MKQIKTINIPMEMTVRYGKMQLYSRECIKNKF